MASLKPLTLARHVNQHYRQHFSKISRSDLKLPKIEPNTPKVDLFESQT